MRREILLAAGVGMLGVAATLFVGRYMIAAGVFLIIATILLMLVALEPLWHRRNITLQVRYPEGSFQGIWEVGDDEMAELPPKKVLRPIAKEIHWTLGIGNDNWLWVVRGAELFLEFVTIGAQIGFTNEEKARWHEADPREGRWQVAKTDKSYGYKFSGPLISGKASVQWPLVVQFRSFGVYEIRWTIVAEGIPPKRARLFMNVGAELFQ